MRHAIKTLTISSERLTFAELANFIFSSQRDFSIRLHENTIADVGRGETNLRTALENGIPLYGVTTGFGDSCHRIVSTDHSAQLQKNLVRYLLCGSGEMLLPNVARATLAIRLKSLSRGYSGVSIELIRRMALFLEKDWLPVIPSRGSLGASGDLIPLAYLAHLLEGHGEAYENEKITPTPNLLERHHIPPYTLKPKEGLALVNGTTVMAAQMLINLRHARGILELAIHGTAWMVLVLKGRTEAFGPLVNQSANRHLGQRDVATKVLTLLQQENYRSTPLQEIKNLNSTTSEFIQDRYSTRCAPQILGPVLETIELGERWLEEEINGTSDNPLFDEEGGIAMGGNFYGGYLSQGLDYLKISLGQIADMVDRQLIHIIDDKNNRGLPPNLANWKGLTDDERHLHHGLKGLHQAVGALTSELLAKTIPNSIFSRSSESHNQDKVSLGMSGAMQCKEVIDLLFTIVTLHLTCLAQAIDLREIKLVGPESLALYKLVRDQVAFVDRDRALDQELNLLKEALIAHVERFEKSGDPS